MLRDPRRHLAVIVRTLQAACRAAGGAELSLLVGGVAAGVAVLFAAGAVATRGPLALLGAVALSGLAGSAVIACLLARRNRPRPALLLLALAVVATGALLGALYRWPLAAPYGILLAYSLVLPHLSLPERRAAILLAVPLAAVFVYAASPDPNWPTAVMVGPLGQLAVGIVVGLILLTLERSRGAVESERTRYRTLVDEAPIGIVRVDPSGRICDANPAAAALFGLADVADLVGRSILDHVVDADAPRELSAVLRSTGTAAGEIELRRVDGTPFWAYHRTRLVRPDEPASGAIGFQGIFVDVTAERSAARTAGQLAAIVESADDAIVGLDSAGRITSWNPAAVRLFGISATAAHGRLLGEVLHVVDDPADGWTVELVGRALAKEVVRSVERLIQTPDGRERLVSMTVSPVVDDRSGVLGASLVARDVSDLRRLERQLGRIVADRSAVLAALRRIQASPSLEATADAVARELSRTDGFRSATILVFEERGSVTQVSSWLAGERSRPHRAVGGERVEELLRRAATGPWVETLERRSAGSYRAELGERGVRQLVYAPLILGDETVGLLALGLSDVGRTAALERLPAAAEFAAVVSALLAPGLLERRRAAGVRARVQAIIDARAFAIVFQPIIDLASGAILGYEALTRFADGTPPDRRFAEAVACGLGHELEVATLEAAFEAAGPLPANAFLDLNVSPDLVLAREPLATLLRGAGWGAVLEITEHAPIGDYDAFRLAVSALGPDVRLAIDDAGAGYASLRHIFELRPAFVKLDRWLTAGIDADGSRQALVAGMVHAAERTDYILVAEGVEREAERRALLELGVRHGQGFLFGRPAPAASWARQAGTNGLRPIPDPPQVSLTRPVGRTALSPTGRRAPARRAAGPPGRGSPGAPPVLRSAAAPVDRGDTPDRR